MHYSREQVRGPWADRHRDDRKLNTLHYYLTEKVPDIHTGYKYPGCTQAELRELDHAHENANRFRGVFRPMSKAQAVARLKAWLKQPPSPDLQSAIDRLREAWNNKNWTPDVAMKCFCDLDRVYFKTSLAGKCRCRWVGSIDTLWKKLGSTDDFGVTVRETGVPVPMARILLNARWMFLAPIDELQCSRKQETFGTLVHEMIHGKFTCPRLFSYSNELTVTVYLYVMSGKWDDDGHDDDFVACAHALNRRTMKDFGRMVLWHERYEDECPRCHGLLRIGKYDDECSRCGKRVPHETDYWRHGTSRMSRLRETLRGYRTTHRGR